jgi:hypothetical protein
MNKLRTLIVYIYRNYNSKFECSVVIVNWYTSNVVNNSFSRSLCWFTAITYFAFKILWHIDPLLGNDSVNTFRREPTCATIGRLLLGNCSVNTPKTIRDNIRCFPWGPLLCCITRSSKGAVSCQKLREFSCKRVHSMSCQKLNRVLKMAVEDDW